MLQLILVDVPVTIMFMSFEHMDIFELMASLSKTSNRTLAK